MKYKIGDKVEYTSVSSAVSKGQKGIVRKVSNDFVGVEWDNAEGHSLGGILANNNGWEVSVGNIRLVEVLSKKQRERKIKKIIKEINGNKDFKESFNDIDKEVKSWSDTKVKGW